MITNINELFVIVPKGLGQKFINIYAKDDKYRQKVTFVEDTGEIWTNGQAFGTNSKTDVEKLSAEVGSIKVQCTEFAEILNGITSDTFKEITAWIQTHGQDFTVLTSKVDDVVTNVAELTTRVTDIENISVWTEFLMDSDMPDVTDDTKIIDNESELASIEDTEVTDIVVTSDDALNYFASISAKTFKNISL